MPDDLGQVGPQFLTDTQRARVRLGKALEAVASDAHVRFYEANYRGRLFHASTPVAGFALPWATSISGTTKDAAIALYNPAGSGINAFIHKTIWSYLSGTVGKGSLIWVYNFNGSTAPANGSGVVASVTPVGGLLNNSGAKCTAYYTTTANSSLFTAAPTVFKPSGLTLMNTLAGTGIAVGGQVADSDDADIMVPPGYACGLFPVGAAGSSELVILSLSWEEQPL